LRKPEKGLLHVSRQHCRKPGPKPRGCYRAEGVISAWRERGAERRHRRARLTASIHQMIRNYDDRCNYH
jgi:hypothetical protein